MQSSSTRPCFHFIQYPETPLIEPNCSVHGAGSEKKIVATDPTEAFEIFKKQNRRLNFFVATVTETGEAFEGYGKQFSIRTILFRPYAKVSQTLVLPFLETEEEGGKIEVAFCGIKDSESEKIHFLKSYTTATYSEGFGVEHQTHSQKAIQILNESGIERRSIQVTDDIDKYESDRFGGNFQVGALKLNVQIRKIIQMKQDHNALLVDEAVAYVAYMKTKKSKAEVRQYFAEKNFALFDVTKCLKGESLYRSTNASAMMILGYLSNMFLSTRDTRTIFFKALEVLSEDFGKELRRRRMKVAYAAIAIIASYFFKDYFFYKF
jgi:hypothetical protein